ncbi:MAG: hypothetical protein ABDH91_04760 [Bacteroidia bacterium]
MWLLEVGATKTDWLIGTPQGLVRHTLQGLNTEAEGWKAAEAYIERLQQVQKLYGFARPRHIWYYGPALHEAEARQRLQSLLAEAFGLPREAVEVAHDLLGAARAAWGEAAGIVGILGTGSNCALWDGQALIQQAGGHGYLLGDEGSGADLGRHFLSALLYAEVPADLEAAFWAENPYPEASAPLRLRQKAYTSARPSAFLAGFAPFLARHQRHPWVKALVSERFTHFHRRTWRRWGIRKPIRYIGGVARAFAGLLEATTCAEGGEWGGIVVDTAEALWAYHQRKEGTRA